MLRRVIQMPLLRLLWYQMDFLTHCPQRTNRRHIKRHTKSYHVLRPHTVGVDPVAVPGASGVKRSEAAMLETP